MQSHAERHGMGDRDLPAPDGLRAGNRRLPSAPAHAAAPVGRRSGCVAVVHSRTALPETATRRKLSVAARAAGRGKALKLRLRHPWRAALQEPFSAPLRQPLRLRPPKAHPGLDPGDSAGVGSVQTELPETRPDYRRPPEKEVGAMHSGPGVAMAAVLFIASVSFLISFVVKHWKG